MWTYTIFPSNFNPPVYQKYVTEYYLVVVCFLLSAFWYSTRSMNFNTGECKSTAVYWWLPCLCSEPVRLVGGNSRCAGTLEVKDGGEWKPVDDFEWTLRTAAVVCRELDCGSAVSVGQRVESSKRPIWWIRSFCVQPEFSVRACERPGYSKKALTLTCSGKPISDITYTYTTQSFVFYSMYIFIFFFKKIFHYNSLTLSQWLFAG